MVTKNVSYRDTYLQVDQKRVPFMVCFQHFRDTKCNTLSIDYNAGQIKENIYKS